MIFISSVMGDELKSARESLVEYLDQRGGVVPWAFEFTPASSEDVDEAYLRKVRESDFVVWLVGERTSEPVINEIKEAISYERRLLVFKFSLVNHDRETKELLQEVGAHAKWVDISNEEELLDAFEKTLNDEIIRAIRAKPGLNRITRLQVLERESRARCIARWQATGLPLEKAIELYSDNSIALPPHQLITRLKESNLQVVTGNLGSGKSLLAERIFQEVIKSSVGDPKQPIPVFIQASTGLDDLERRVLEESKGLGNPKTQGAFVIVDGVDESGLGNSIKVLNEARYLTQAWENTYILITSRPSHAFKGEEIYKIGGLEVEEIVSIAQKTSNIELRPSFVRSQSEPVRNIIAHPLFAILWARFLERQDIGFAGSTGDLISFLVEDVTQNLEDKVHGLLEVVGTRVINDGGVFIPWREIISRSDLNLILETRLVSIVDQKIGFPLPVLAEWFAAQGLVNNRMDINELCRDFLRLERWRYPLIIIASQYNHDDVSRILTPVIEHNPGLAAGIVTEGIRGFGLEPNQPLPSSVECGERIRQAHSAWVTGLGELAKHISPVASDGTLDTIGVNANGDRLVIAWNKDRDIEGGIVELPAGGIMGLPEASPGWYIAKSGPVGPKMAWAWRWSLDELTDNMSGFIRSRAYLPRGGHMYREKMWELALQVMDRGDLYDGDIQLDELSARLKDWIPDFHEDQRTQWHDLLEYIHNKIGEGEGILIPPWPTGDDVKRKSGGIWEDYSDEQTLKRAKAVFTAALEEYSNIINGLFVQLKPRMRIGTLLPVKMHGNIHFQDSISTAGSPSLDWYFEPLPAGSDNEVEFVLSGKRKVMIDDNDLVIMTRKRRPAAKEWLSPFKSFSRLDVFQPCPVTEIVYRWLEDDLRDIDWV